MAFTGRLGTGDSQLGNIELGDEGFTGAEYSRTATDTVTTSDSIAAARTQVRTATDTTSASDAIVAAGVFTRSAADAPSLSESVAGAAGFTRTVSDSLSVSDSIALAIGVERLVSDSLTTSESITGASGLSRTVSDSLTTGASAFQIDAFQIDAFQGEPISDSIAQQAAYIRTAIDTVSTSESVATYNGVVREVSDTATTSDSIAAVQGRFRTVSDSVSVSATVSRQLVATRRLSDEVTTEEWMVPLPAPVGDPYGGLPDGYMPVLTAPINDTQTTITVTEPMPAGVILPLLVYIGGEYLLVTAVSPDGLTWTVVRGANTSTAAPHPSINVQPASTTISVNGVQIGADVDYRRTRLTTYANGNPGAGEIWVRDVDRVMSFTTGHEVVVRHRNIRVWGGYVMRVRRTYAFASGTGSGDEPRYLVLEVADYNILFRKRIYFRDNDPTKMIVRQWPNGTHDDTVIGNVVNLYLDLSDDGLHYDIHHVGTPMPVTVSCNPEAPDVFGVGSAGHTWGDVMAAIASQTGAIYYIDPDKVFRYVDDSVKQSAFGYTGLSDDPSGTMVGYRNFELVYDGAKLVNEQFTWGVGQGATAPVLGHATAPVSIEQHGLWQQAELRYDMYCQDTVDLRANTWLDGSPQNHRGHKTDRISGRATVFHPYFRVADVLEFESTSFGFDSNVPVRGAEISFPTPWDIQCVLTLSHEKDAPWDAFEFFFPRFGFDFDFPPIVFDGLISFPPFVPCEEENGPPPGTIITDWGYGHGLADYRINQNVDASCQTSAFFVSTFSGPGSVGQSGFANPDCGGGRQRDWLGIPITLSGLTARWAKVDVGDSATTTEVSVYFTTSVATPTQGATPDLVVDATTIFSIPDGMRAWIQAGPRPVALGELVNWNWGSNGDANPPIVSVWYNVDTDWAPCPQEEPNTATIEVNGTSVASQTRLVDPGGETLSSFALPAEFVFQMWMENTGAPTSPTVSAHYGVILATNPNNVAVLWYADLNRVELQGNAFSSASLGATVRRWYRLRVESNAIRLRWWGLGSEEPGIWYLNDTTPLTQTSAKFRPGVTQTVSGNTKLNIAQLSVASPTFSGMLDTFNRTFAGDGVTSGLLGSWGTSADSGYGWVEVVNTATVPSTVFYVAQSTAEPTSTDPPDEGTQYGAHPASGGVELPNGNFLYCFDMQFQYNSSEVWADGYRLRLNDDYIEHALEGCIEVISTAEVGPGTFDSSMVITANFKPWLIQDPPPEFVI